MLTSSTITGIGARRTPTTKEMTLSNASTIARVKCSKLEVIAMAYGIYEQSFAICSRIRVRKRSRQCWSVTWRFNVLHGGNKEAQEVMYLLESTDTRWLVSAFLLFETARIHVACSGRLSTHDSQHNFSAPCLWSLRSSAYLCLLIPCEW